MQGDFLIVSQPSRSSRAASKHVCGGFCTNTRSLRPGGIVRFCALPLTTHFQVSLAQRQAFVLCCTDRAVPYSDLSSFFPPQLKHSFHDGWLDTFGILPALVHVVIWADTLPVSQLGYFLLSFSITFRKYQFNCVLDTNCPIPHFVCCRCKIIMDIKFMTLTLGLKTQTASRQR